MDRNTEFAGIANQLENLNTQIKNPKFNAKTLEMLALLYKNKDFVKSEKYGLEALAMAEKNQFSNIKTLKSLMSIIYFDNNQMQKGLEFTGINGNIATMSAIELFNAGSMLEDMGTLNRAEEFYLKALGKAKNNLEGKSDREKLTNRAKYDAIYAGLASVYNKQNKPSKVFDIVEKSKAQGLSAKLNAQPITVKTLQATLKTDEAYVSYKIMDPSNVMIVVVTKNDVQCDKRSLVSLVQPLKNNFSNELYKLDEKLSGQAYAQPNYVKVTESSKKAKRLNEGDFGLIVEFYRSYLTQELGELISYMNTSDIENVGKIMQEEFYGTLVWPFEQATGKKKKYFLSLDGALNFIPFESFRDENGKYLSETRQFNVVTSASILDLINKRNYVSSKKSVLAFGGAIYEEPKSSVGRVSSLAELKDWQLKAFDLTESGKSLTDLFHALGYAKMNYLQGTLNEVQEIGNIHADAKVITGLDMNEASVKAMSKSGELKNYKVLHFATHGWSINTLPTASGLAMSIPEVSTDGQDGRLIANEIANLDIEANMVMLSACQTGLGKLYGGEGVVGLNQSLFIAGANATIVSLWPVNDYATSIMVKELYRIANSNGGDYASALLQVKRNFISGSYNKDGMDLTHPIYWAPFVYNGK